MAGLVAAAAPTGPQLVLASDRLANSNLIRMASIQILQTSPYKNIEIISLKLYTTFMVV